jgi:hypothetical protein
MSSAQHSDLKVHLYQSLVVMQVSVSQNAMCKIPELRQQQKNVFLEDVAAGYRSSDPGEAVTKATTKTTTTRT